MAGVDEKGGAVYGYDAVGSYQRLMYACEGSGGDLVTPALDKILEGRADIWHQRLTIYRIQH